MAVTLTDRAAEHVQRYMQKRGKGIGLRLGVFAVQRVAHAGFEAGAEVVGIAAQQDTEPALRRGVAHQAWLLRVARRP